MDAQLLSEFLIWFLVFIASSTVHEAAHALVAWKGGDPTAKLGGQVSLNPVPHMQREPVGMVLLPLASFFLSGGKWMYGWASAPIDPHWARRYPLRQALMSLAGPVSNLLLLLLAYLVAKGLIAADVLSGLVEDVYLEENSTYLVVPAAGQGESGPLRMIAFVLSVAMLLNLVLFVFNLMPILPLDGGWILQGLFPKTLRPLEDWFAELPSLRFVGLAIAWKLSDYPLDWSIDILLQALYG